MNQSSNNISTRVILTTVGYMIYNLIIVNSCLGLGIYTLIMMFDGDMTPLEPIMDIIILTSAIAVMILSVMSVSKKDNLDKLKSKLIYQIIMDKQLKLSVIFSTWLAWASNYYELDKWVFENMISIWWIYIIFIVGIIVNKKLFRKTLKEIKEVIGNGN